MHPIAENDPTTANIASLLGVKAQEVCADWGLLRLFATPFLPGDTTQGANDITQH